MGWIILGLIIIAIMLLVLAIKYKVVGDMFMLFISPGSGGSGSSDDDFGGGSSGGGGASDDW